MTIEHVPSGIERAPERERRAFMETATRALIDRSAREWRTVPLERRDATVDRMYGHGRLNFLKGFRDDAIDFIDGPYNKETKRRERGILQPLLAATDPRDIDAQKRLEAICDALKSDPPEYGDEPHAADHPYLSYSTVAPLNDRGEDAEPLSLYQTNRSAVDADLRFLKDMRESFPGSSHEETRAAIDGLIARLEAYLFSDPKYAIQEQVERSIPESTMDKQGKKLGRIALTGVLAGGTLIFGTIAAVNFVRGIFSENHEVRLTATPFLWAFATFFVADPGLVKSFFGSKYDTEFKEIRDVTSSDALRRLCGTYGMGGERWRTVVEGVYENDPAVKAVLGSANPTDEQVEEAADALSGGHADVAASLRTMMRTRKDGSATTDFRRFAETLRAADSTEAREFIATYMEHDCVRDGMRHDAAAGRALHAAADGTK